MVEVGGSFRNGARLCGCEWGSRVVGALIIKAVQSSTSDRVNLQRWVGTSYIYSSTCTSVKYWWIAGYFQLLILSLLHFFLFSNYRDSKQSELFLNT